MTLFQSIFRLTPSLALALAFALAGVSPAKAQQHRATRLGDPAHRFAPPLKQPEDLRRLLLDEKLKEDIASILRQAGWKGDLADLLKAARTQTISEIRLPKGTRMPFMSSRDKGKPVALIDVLWAGKEPVEALGFEFTSKGRLYHLITPKPCSNFYIVDLGPAPTPSLRLEKLAPARVTVCAPLEFKYVVRNAGKAPARQVRISETLPAGLTTIDQQSQVSFDAGDLKPGESRTFSTVVRASAPGSFPSTARATCAEKLVAEASGSTIVRAPILALDCQAPAELPIARPITICLTVRNDGEVPEPHAVLELPVPAGATATSNTGNGTLADGRIVWDLGELAPKSQRQVCATFTREGTGSLAFQASAKGTCAAPVECSRGTRIAGIAAILLEVVDLADPIEVGNQVEYEIRVVNQGSGPITRIQLVCSIPEAQEFVDGSGATLFRGAGRTATSEPLATLEPKAEAIWKLRVKALVAGDIRFKVDLTADQFPRSVEEYEATSQY